MARAQIQIEARDNVGAPIASASIALTHRVGGGAVTHYADETGGSGVTTAIVTDANGRSAPRWVDSGSYSAAITKAGYTAVSRAIDVVRADAVDQIADNSVDTVQIADGAVTGAKLTSNTATLGKFAALAVTEPKLADNAVTAAKVAVGTVTNTKIADGAVTEAKILDRSILAEHINPGAVGGGTVGTNELADGSVDNAALNDEQVLTIHLSTDVVTTAKLAPNSIEEWHLPDGALGPEHIVDSVMPVGMIIAYAGQTAPSTEWMVLHGQSLATAAYPALHARLGYTYGGSGANFNLPDYRGRTPVGVGTEGAVAGTNYNDSWPLGVHINNRGPAHGHTIGSIHVTGGGDHYHWYWQGSDAGGGQCGGNGPDHLYGGQVASGTHNTGEHSHPITGLAGDLTDPNWPANANNMVHHQVVQFIIKVK